MSNKSRLSALIMAPGPDLEAIANYLDEVPHETRLSQVRSLGRRPQKRLFAAARGFRTLRVSDFVPLGTEPLTEVVHYGKNTLPAFSHFAKVFCRATDDSGELWGYNRNPGLIETAVGPGYFVTYDQGDNEVLIDYLRVPGGKAESWPDMLPNKARLSRFVYYQTQDVMRGVSTHVSIGRGTRKGKDMPAWFALCREA